MKTICYDNVVGGVQAAPPAVEILMERIDAVVLLDLARVVAMSRRAEMKHFSDLANKLVSSLTAGGV